MIVCKKKLFELEKIKKKIWLQCKYNLSNRLIR